MAFQEKDAEFFFGRETFVDSLVQVVQQQPLVAVIGSSGSGKSSVVLAGLIPKLREAGSWLIESFRPNQQPFYELAAALISQLEPELGKTDKTIKAKELAQSIREHGFTADVSAILKNKPGKRLLLVVDQFEELYTGCSDTEQQQFVDALLAAVESASRAVTLVLTLRADFYSYVVNYPRLTEALNNYPAKNITLMNAEEMRAAIELPAKKIGVKLEQGLTQRILDDVKQEPGNLPLLEFALTQLWDKQSRGQLAHQAYSAIGGVAKALSNHAEAVYGKLSEQEQKQVQRIFLQLVRPGEGTEDTRRVATRAEVGNWELVRFLAGEEARLVVTGRDEQTKEETVEVVHEALIREWQRLRRWIDENRDKLKQKKQIEAAAEEWRKKEKSKDYLLQGKLLKDARAFQRERAGELKLSILAEDFIQESQTHRRVTTIKTVSLLATPLLIAFLGVIPLMRQGNQQKALNTIKARGAGTRESLEFLSEGCWKSKDWKWMPDYLVTLLFGNCADLTGINLREASLFGAKLNSAKLIGANFSNTDLTHAKFSSANLNGAKFISAKLQVADFSHANLVYTDLRGANLRSTKFIGTTLNGAKFNGADLSSANLNGANLGGVTYAEPGNPSKIEYFRTDLRGVRNLTPKQVKSARNWEKAIYDEDLCRKLGLK